MKKFFKFLLIIVNSLAIAEGVWFKEGEKEATIGNNHFTLYLSKERGWLLDRLESAKVGVMLSDFHIYTDWGIYPRGYVGSKEEKEGTLKIEKEGDNVFAVAEGELKKEGGVVEEPLKYKVRYKIGSNKRMEVEIEVNFQGKPRNVSAFLAHIFVIPFVKQWIVNSIDGFISEDSENIVGRCWESRDEPLSFENPQILVFTRWGALSIENIRCEPQAQNIFLFSGGNHNLVFFLAFMDGSLQEVNSFKASFEIVFEI